MWLLAPLSAPAGVERGWGRGGEYNVQKNKNAANNLAIGTSRTHYARKACFNSSPSSGLSAKGSVGLRPSMMSSSRVCTEASALGWL